MIPDPWLTVPMAALAVARPTRTIRTWISRGKVPVICDLRTRTLLVHLPSLGEYAQSSEMRFARPEHAHRRRVRTAA